MLRRPPRFNLASDAKPVTCLVMSAMTAEGKKVLTFPALEQKSLRESPHPCCDNRGWANLADLTEGPLKEGAKNQGP